MKITKIQAMRLVVPDHGATTAPRRPSWAEDTEVANPTTLSS